MNTGKYIAAAAIFVLCAACGNRATKSPDKIAGTEQMTVASEMVDCVGVGLRRCLVVKPEGVYDWELFYDMIDGFEYEPGYEYVITVFKENVEMPPADGSTVKYILDRIVSKQKKQSKNIPDTSHITEAYKEKGWD